MNTEVESKMVLRRRILPFLQRPWRASPSDPQPPRRKPPAWSGLKTGAESASIGVMSAAEARLHQKQFAQAQPTQSQTPAQKQ
jgi:hypothetical protein